MDKLQRVGFYAAIAVALFLAKCSYDANVRAEFESEQRAKEVEQIQREWQRSNRRLIQARKEYYRYVDSVEKVVDNYRRRLQILDRQFEELKPTVVERAKDECPQLVDPLNALISACEARKLQSDSLVSAYLARIERDSAHILELDRSIAERDSNTVNLIDDFKDERKRNGVSFWQKLQYGGIGAGIIAILKTVF